MKTLLTLLLLSLSSFVMALGPGSGEKTLGEGSQPQVSVDMHGVIRVIYGENDKIFYSESHNGGLMFSRPSLVAQIPGMHLGMSRGPQLASSNRYSVVTAIDTTGSIHWFRLNHASGNWQNMGLINDRPHSAPEGMMNVAADKNDHFYAVWLDIRTGIHNQIYFAGLAPEANKWSKNKLVYLSPDEHVCECCQPHIAVNGNEVDIMFRNWLNGSRDLYLLASNNAGASFAAPQKLGEGTWKLNACPMDGGGLVAGEGAAETTWQRAGTIFYCKAGQPEKALGLGRGSTIATTNSGAFIGYQAKDTLMLVNLKNSKAQAIGTGRFIKLAVMPNQKIVCVWELDDKVILKVL